MGRENHARRWRGTAIVFVGLLLTGGLTRPAAAVNSAECEAMEGTYKIKFWGQSFIAAWELYTIELKLEKGKSFSFWTNWGPNVSLEVNASEPSLTARYTRPPLSIFGTRYVAAAGDPQETLRMATLAGQYLVVPRRNASDFWQKDVEAKKKALECAQKRLNDFSADVRRRYLQTGVVELSSTRGAHPAQSGSH